jgi:rare lipoprotein A (peptidoglycan hydrolase)
MSNTIIKFVTRPIVLVLMLLVSQSVFAESSTASYYTVASCQRESKAVTSGIYTANGERYDEQALTCARPWRSCLGKTYNVYNTKTNKSVFVVCNDIGPNKKLAKHGRTIDLTPYAFKKLGGDLKNGIIAVEVQEVKD